MTNRSAFLPLALLLAGCAATPTTSPVSPVVTSPPIATAVAPREVAPSAAVSPLLAAASADTTLLVRFNGRALREAPLYAAAMSAIKGFDVFQRRLDEWNERCGVPILYAVDEVLVVGTSPQDVVVVASIRGGGPRTLRCIGTMAGERSDPPLEVFEGGQILRLSGSRAVVFAENLFFVGPEASVERALKAFRRRDGAVVKVADSLTHGPDAVLAFSLDGPGYGPVPSANGVLELDATHLTLRAVASLGSENEASTLAQTIHAGIDSASAELGVAPDGVGEALKGYLASIQVAPAGKRLLAQMDLPGGAEAQARLIGTIAGLGIYGVRQYLAQSKLVEAKVTVSSLARGLVAYMETQDARGKRPTRFPPSAPPTPAKVPAGTKFAPDATTWSHPTWKALRFEMENPMYYSYEIITSKDGRSATVRAHGDLDGDGKLSTIERTVTLEKSGTVVMDPKLVLQDETE